MTFVDFNSATDEEVLASIRPNTMPLTLPSSPPSTTRPLPPPSPVTSPSTPSQYINGHSDVLMGAIIFPNASTAEAHAHPLVKDIIDAGFAEHPGHNNAAKILAPHAQGTSGRAEAISLSVGWSRLGSAGLVDDGATERSSESTRTRLFTLAESLGGVKSLADLAEKMTHGSIPPTERLALGIPPDLIR
ncbi:hypothetical protein M422DRAFT_270779 [Sphaerobolus stellatus SS14]|uniref:cystathionine gamma-lyase n=1 Tax=Sphaerobolus stellatus (strain SS14) TaxID=990650 RepID=A0A0C9US28_SPHS4|nr:hypothetical protein M422DRAFT_270779 [Sphaerobolus stellatus SS14]